MGFFDFLKPKKKKKSETAADAAADAVMELEVDPADIDPPETRYTQEYRDFLASQEAVEAVGKPGEEE